jgi:UDP-N-acetylmuramoylalanine--D-glutamate ligase
MPKLSLQKTWPSVQDSSQLFVVMGLGKTGLSCVRYLANKSYSVAVVDTRENPPGLDECKTQWPNISVYTGGWHPEILNQALTIIISPGLSLQEPCLIDARQRGIEIIGDIELFAREAKAPVVAITGANAKTTVTTIVGEMAKAAGLNVRVGGNIGMPALDLLEQTEPDLYILELSSFQLESTCSLHPVAATVLNITPDHLDRYASFEDYKAAKQRIYHNAKVKIYNQEDKNTWVEGGISFGLNLPLPLPISQLKIKGRHNQLNAAAALALGTAVNFSMEIMLQVLREFPGLPHRCQWVRERNGVVWYNDSKGTNVGATLAAMDGLADTLSESGKLILIAGGIGKGADFSPLRESVSKYVRTAILFGQDAKKLQTALQGTTDVQLTDSLEKAAFLAAVAAQSGDIVLLSPACSSLDMFQSFEHRGDSYIQFVHALS